MQNLLIAEQVAYIVTTRLYTVKGRDDLFLTASPHMITLLALTFSEPQERNEGCRYKAVNALHVGRDSTQGGARVSNGQGLHCLHLEGEYDDDVVAAVVDSGEEEENYHDYCGDDDGYEDGGDDDDYGGGEEEEKEGGGGENKNNNNKKARQART